MRGAARIDENQPLIVDCLRRCGCKVEILSRMGGGVPDLLVGTPRGQLILIEVKDGKRRLSDQRLTPDQVTWHEQWRRYPVFVVHDTTEALDAMGHECTAFDIDRHGKRTCSGCFREL